MTLQNYILLLLGVILLATMVIVIVFVIINACIKKKAAKYRTKSQESSTSHEKGRLFNNLYDQEGKPPPLPSRLQFETDSHDYEDAISLPDIPEEPVKPSLLQPQTTVNHLDNHKAFQDNKSISESYDDVNAIEQNGHMCVDVNFPPVNLKEPAEPRTINCDHTDFQDNKSISENYDDVDEIEQNVVDSFNDDLTPPDYLDLDQSRNSLDSYYDIGELDVESEDYDDLG